MSIIKLITTVSLAVALITMIESNQPSIFAYATTEDDGWVEGDYEGSPEEQEEQAQEDWEDAGRPGEIEDENENDENDNENENDNSEELVECEDGSLVETEDLCEQSELVQDPCVLNPDLPECQDPCVLNPDLPECAPPIPCPDGGDPLADGSCPPIPCPDGGDPLADGSCPPIPCSDGGDPLADGSCPPIPCPVGELGCPPPPPKCGPGTHLEDGKCLPNKKNGGSSSSSSSSSSSASATTNVIGTEVSSCRLDGNAHGIKQKFDTAKYQACGLYPTGQIAYTDGFVLGCTQVGNTPQLCQAFVVMNTQQTQTAATQSNMRPTTQPTQAIQPSGVS